MISGSIRYKHPFKFRLGLFVTSPWPWPGPESDILKTRILVWVPLPTFRDPTSHSKMLGLEIFPHPTCEVKGSGDCECLHPISHMASEKWEVGTQTRIPIFKISYSGRGVSPRARLTWNSVQARSHLPFPSLAASRRSFGEIRIPSEVFSLHPARDAKSMKSSCSLSI